MFLSSWFLHLPCRFTDITCSDSDGFDTAGVAGIGGIHGIFGKDDRVVVGEGHALAAMLLCGNGDGFGGSLVHQAVHIAGFADVPVLAELACQVAAGGAEGEHAAARVKVVKRFFLDGIDAETGRAAIGGEDDLVVLAHAYETGAALPFVQLAVTWAKVALDAAIIYLVPVTAYVVRVICHADMPSSVSSCWFLKSRSFHLLTV